MSNSQRFLDAFARIEQHLRRRVSVPDSATFYQIVNEAARVLPEVRRIADDLKEYSDLRNAIVHKSAGGVVIAEPNARAVADMERYALRLNKPPTVAQMKLPKVQVVSPEDSVAKAVLIMREHAFSQLPVVAEGQWVGLLTTDTVTRWLGALISEDVFSLGETTVREVLRHAEAVDNYLFVARDTSLPQVLELFREFESKGKRLDAVLITESGKQGQKILGVLTVNDLPRLLSQLD